MAGKSNAKGSAFERLVCRKLTKWITGQARPEIFWRSATSGAKATTEAKAGRASHMGGDIVAVHPDGQWFTDMFSVECKDRKSFGTLPHLLLGKAALLEWWKQCCADAEREPPGFKKSKKNTREPLMIFKQRGSPIYVAWRFVPFKHPPSTMLLMVRGPLNVCLLDDLLALNHPGTIRKAREPSADAELVDRTRYYATVAEGLAAQAGYADIGKGLRQAFEKAAARAAGAR